MVLSLLLIIAEAANVPAAIDVRPAVTSSQEQGLQQLLTVRRVYVDRLSGGETAAQMRDMIMSSLQGAKLFFLTENAERADAFLRGSAEDLVFTDEHSSSDSVHGQASMGSSDSDTNSSYSGGFGGVLGSAHSTF